MACVCGGGGGALHHCFMERVNCCICPPRGQSVYNRLFIHAHILG